MMKVFLNCDGNTAVTNPGEAAFGFVIRDEDESIIATAGERIGFASNNESEYSGLIAGLYNCHLLGAKEVEVRLDSQLLVRQMTGAYAVRAKNLKPYWTEAQREVERFRNVKFKWIPRKDNSLADALANEALGK